MADKARWGKTKSQLTRAALRDVDTTDDQEENGATINSDAHIEGQEVTDGEHNSTSSEPCSSEDEAIDVLLDGQVSTRALSVSSANNKADQWNTDRVDASPNVPKQSQEGVQLTPLDIIDR